MTGYVLAKIGRREHMQDLAENGTVYMSRLSVFQRCKEKERGDPYEGLFSL